ncbi:MAG: helix-turn-helix domain-containing protein [Neobacillus sp.]
MREQRFDKAFSLLEDGEHNVSETAFAVGYTNVSHFSKTFKERFGITPRDLCK